MYDGLKNLEVPRQRGPRRRRALRAGLVAMLVILLFVTGTGIYVFQKVNGAFNNTHRELPTDALLPDQPMNVLVVGSDRRDVVDASERKQNAALRGPGGQRADTIVLIHISAQAKKAVAVHFPRDLRVEIPGRGTNKINAAYAFGGPALMIETVRAFSGLPIHHYVEINFNSFRNIVDAAGGVNICVTKGYDDRRSGLKIPRAGCYEMDGDMSLAFVRARYIDPRADLGRIERQQLFMRSLMGKVKSVGLIFNPVKVSGLADAISTGIVTSDKVDLRLARGIAGKLAANQKRVDYRIVPGVPKYIRGISYVLPDNGDAQKLFTAMLNDATLPNVGKTGLSLPARKDVTLRLLNGTGTSGFAGDQSRRLKSLGFTVRAVDTAKAAVEVTTIDFAPGADLKARLLEEEYPGATVRVSTIKLPGDVDVVVTLGADALAAASPGPGPS